MPEKAIRFDRANDRIPLPTQTGNLIVTLAWHTACCGPRRLFSTHLDTGPFVVPWGRADRSAQRAIAIVPARKNGSWVVKQSHGSRVPGDDDCAEKPLSQNLPHGPLTVLFTVREESGLWGAADGRTERLGPARRDGLQHRRRGSP